MSSVKKHLLYLVGGGYFTHRGWRMVWNENSDWNQLPREDFYHRGRGETREALQKSVCS